MPDEKNKQKRPLFNAEGLDQKLDSISKNMETFLSIVNQVDKEEYKKQEAPLKYERVDYKIEPATEVIKKVNELKNKIEKDEIASMESAQLLASIIDEYNDVLGYTIGSVQSSESLMQKDAEKGKYKEFTEKFGDFYSSFVDFASQSKQYMADIEDVTLTVGDKISKSVVEDISYSMTEYYKQIEETTKFSKLEGFLSEIKENAKNCANQLGRNDLNFFNSFDPLYKDMLNAEIKYAHYINGIDDQISGFKERQENGEILSDKDALELRKLEKGRPEIGKHYKEFSKQRQQLSGLAYYLYDIDPQTRKEPDKVEKDFIDKESIDELSNLISSMGDVDIDGRLLIEDEITNLSDALSGVKESFEKGSDDLGEKCKDFYDQLKELVETLPDASCLQDYSKFNEKSLPKENLEKLLAVHTAFGKYGTVLEKTIQQKELELKTKAAEEVKKKAEAKEASKKKSPEELSKERERFGILAKGLESAKTLTNSKEYISIINAVKELANNNSEDRIKKMVDVSMKINSYLEHKSKDGVKANVFKKFAAVEILSKEIDEKLKPYDDQKVKIDDEVIKVKDCELGLNEKVAKLSSMSKIKYNAAISNDQFNIGNVDKEMAGYSQIQKIKVKAFMDPAHTCLKKVIANASGKNYNTKDLSGMLNKFGDVSFACKEVGIKSPEVQKERKSDLGSLGI